MGLFGRTFSHTHTHPSITVEICLDANKMYNVSNVKHFAVLCFNFSSRVGSCAAVFHPEFGTRGANLQTQFRRSSRVLLQWIVSGLTVQWAVSGLIVQWIVSRLIVSG